MIKKISPKLDQMEFLALARKRMSVAMPRDEQYGEVYFPEGDNQYFYFSGLWHIEANLVNAQITRNLQEGASMLSVGSGDGHLERLLVSGFGVPKENINIADLNARPKIKGFGFLYHEFDMTLNWPRLNKKFDYIIFPESLGVALLLKEETLTAEKRGCHICRFYDTIEKVVRLVKSNGKIKKTDKELFITLAEADIPRVQWIYKIVSEANKNLSKNGEIRVSRGGGIQSDHEFAYLALKSEKNCDSLVSSYQNGLPVFRRR